MRDSFGQGSGGKSKRPIIQPAMGHVVFDAGVFGMSHDLFGMNGYRYVIFEWSKVQFWDDPDIRGVWCSLSF